VVPAGGQALELVTCPPIRAVVIRFGDELPSHRGKPQLIEYGSDT
jgi:hypothetical protein